eukprot:m.73710 g.73710  ORF g.73710 m.73710 type:complete len:492 (+) comp14475_c0_seq1:307-1782(+)
MRPHLHLPHLLLLLSLLLPLCLAAADASESAGSNASVALVPRNVEGRSRFAYVTIHYEGTANDAQYILGIRVLLKSLKPLRYPFIVLVSHTVSQHTRDLLASEGAQIQQVVDVENPFGHVLKRFQYTFNKLHLWNLTDYDRVIYFDADNIVIQKDMVDSLFLCGQFCVVYMNPCHFHTGLMVVKPNAELYAKMRHRLAQTGSFDGADQGFLSAYFGKEGPCAEAPLFNPANGPSEALMNTLHIGYNMHALYMLANDDMEIYRCGPFAKLPADELPVATIAWPVPTIIKPFLWWTFVVGHTHEWNKVRAGLDEPEMVFYFYTRLPLVLVGYLVVMLALDRVTAHERAGSAWHARIKHLGATPTASTGGLLIFFAALSFGLWLTPVVMPLHMAGALCFAAAFACYHVLARLFAFYVLLCPSTLRSLVPAFAELRICFLSTALLFSINYIRALFLPHGLVFTIISAIGFILLMCHSYVNVLVKVALQQSPLFAT